MLKAAIFYMALAMVVGFAFARGGRDERLAAIAMLMAAAATPLLVQQQFAGPEAGVILVDIALFLALSAIAMQSTRFWPLWAAGFQLGAVVVHFASSRLPELIPAAYAETLVIWSYPVLAALLLGAVLEGARGHRQ
ncbi:hypothetical protein [Thermaurantiacus sp.]